MRKLQVRLKCGSDQCSNLIFIRNILALNVIEKEKVALLISHFTISSFFFFKFLE
jgi:hypothetical protein